MNGYGHTRGGNIQEKIYNFLSINYLILVL